MDYIPVFNHPVVIVTGVTRKQGQSVVTLIVEHSNNLYLKNNIYKFCCLNGTV